MAEEELATIQASAQNIRNMVNQAALGGTGDPFHDDLYFNIHDSGVVSLIGGKPGDVTQTYCTFSDPYLGEVTSAHEDGTQAVVDVADFLTYGLDFASDGGELKVAFRGDPEDEIASVVEFYGAVNSRVMSPVAGDVLEEVPTSIVKNFPDGDGKYVSVEKGKPFPTNIRVDVSQIQRIIEVIDHDPSTDFYPITVEEGELTLDVGRDGGRNAVWGDLEANSVDGPDVSNQYKKGFPEVFKALSNEVWLQTAPDGAPVCVAQDGEDGQVLRHVIGNMSD